MKKTYQVKYNKALLTDEQAKNWEKLNKSNDEEREKNFQLKRKSK